MYVCTPPSHNSAESSLIFFTILALTHCICEAADTHKTDCLLAIYLKNIHDCQLPSNVQLMQQYS